MFDIPKFKQVILLLCISNDSYSAAPSIPEVWYTDRTLHLNYKNNMP